MTQRRTSRDTWTRYFGPLYRYRHARAVHAVRIGVAVLLSMVLTTGLDLPHGVWATVTLIVVIGGLQHHGNIRKRAFERALGTLSGATMGLACLGLQSVLGWQWLTFVMLSGCTAVCAYHAIGKGGYIALLTAITLCIVAGRGDNSFDTGLWRSANVLLGIVMALAFSFALPLHATYSWRYRLADNLRLCARLLAHLDSGQAMPRAVLREHFARLSRGLVALRGLMPSVAKETGVPLQWLDDCQREQRVMIAALDIIAELMLDGDDLAQATPSLDAASHARLKQWRKVLLLESRALELGRTRRLAQMTAPAVRPTLGTHAMAPLIDQAAARAERMRQMLLEQEERLGLGKRALGR